MTSRQRVKWVCSASACTHKLGFGGRPDIKEVSFKIKMNLREMSCVS
uniref:Uncharacterized protein n=1 Tax=Vitis vinifera TaxID=29760 RepID=F6H900_VITVI